MLKNGLEIQKVNLAVIKTGLMMKANPPVMNKTNLSLKTMEDASKVAVVERVEEALRERRSHLVPMETNPYVPMALLK
jgi:hypothetical protein